MTEHRDLDELLALRPRMKALAVRLLGDPELAEDTVQEALLAAMRRPLRPGPGLDGWFQTVTRRIALRTYKDRAARSWREQKASSPERTEDRNAELEPSSMVAEVRAAVDRLGEPYRTVVELRYFEGLSNDMIAAHLGVPAATVRTRLHRAVADEVAFRRRERSTDRGNARPGHLGRGLGESLYSLGRHR